MFRQSRLSLTGWCRWLPPESVSTASPLFHLPESPRPALRLRKSGSLTNRCPGGSRPPVPLPGASRLSHIEPEVGGFRRADRRHRICAGGTAPTLPRRPDPFGMLVASCPGRRRAAALVQARRLPQTSSQSATISVQGDPSRLLPRWGAGGRSARQCRKIGLAFFPSRSASTVTPRAPSPWRSMRM